jgi:poly(U)-specific endoribonuclease
MLFLWTSILLGLFVAAVKAQPTTDEIRDISEQIWAGDVNRIVGNDVQYNVNSAPLFSYVNEARFGGTTTFARMIALFDNYTPETNVPETCGQPCRVEEEAFLDSILDTRPMQLLHNWLVPRGLASQTQAAFKTELRQYWFMPYTRSGGPLGSTGFEHTFVGELHNNAVSGFHNWVQTYYEEKLGTFRYGSITRTCPNETFAFAFTWLGRNKPISSMFIRSSPEVEIALYTLCLLARMGNGCPIRLNGVNQVMTAWDMTGLPKTIGSSYPNC